MKKYLYTLALCTLTILSQSAFATETKGGTKDEHLVCRADQQKAYVTYASKNNLGSVFVCMLKGNGDSEAGIKHVQNELEKQLKKPGLIILNLRLLVA